jgi:hypothetical protein
MSVKRKVGRPRKTSTPVVKEKKVNTNWRQKYDDLYNAVKVQEEMHERFKQSATQVLSEQADNQLEIVKLVLDSYHSIEEQCKTALELTGSIEEADVIYLTSFARRVLLNKFTDFNKASED